MFVDDSNLYSDLTGQQEKSSGPLSFSDYDLFMPKDLNLHRMKLKYLELALRRTGGNRSQSAKLLGVTFRWVRQLIRTHGLASKYPPKKQYGKRETKKS